MGALKKFWHDGWTEGNSTERLRIVITLVLAVAVLALSLALFSFKDTVYRIRTDQIKARTDRQNFQVEQHDANCEVIHKLNIYFAPCNVVTTTTTP